MPTVLSGLATLIVSGYTGDDYHRCTFRARLLSEREARERGEYQTHLFQYFTTTLGGREWTGRIWKQGAIGGAAGRLLALPAIVEDVRIVLDEDAAEERAEIAKGGGCAPGLAAVPTPV